MMPDKDALFSKLASAGEKSVREKLAQGVYGPDKINLVHEWLRQREEERINDATSRAASAASRAEAATSEQLRLTRSATRAAWIAAMAAIIAIIVPIILEIIKTSK
jgi:hypothetical protein